MRTTAPQTPLDARPAQTDEQRQLIDVPTLAQRLGVTERFVRRLTSEDRVPFLKIGKFVRFDPMDIDRWVDERRRSPSPPPR